ncbi:UNKNOWN [Stylonychia lemnae]|uniref:VIT domain-containing protein n=1 Tax=Stylonychia lemnae TaxID=5949 RepID=A0A077ZY94_STYLE|nr:UNKNOWN [Stylonychia lemnae]|eukprot:CDW74866.1 UNKNOWN [Stylonychia lemnae]
MPLEIVLHLPIQEDFAIGSLTVQIGDKIIEGKIFEKQQARQKYEDAITQGKTAILAEENEMKQDQIKLLVGNLLPKQNATLNFQLYNILELQGGAYCFKMPINYFPNFERENYDYDYHFQIEIFSDIPISYVSYPTHGQVSKMTHDQDLFQVKIFKEGKNVQCLEKDLIIYYRTQQMEHISLYYQESNSYPNQVALMISFVPQLIEQKISENEFIQLEDDIPDPQDIQFEPHSDKLFIFLVDRSISMVGQKIQITIQTLIIFLKSLPVNSSFEIISFGLDCESLSHYKGLFYDTINLNNALEIVQKFKANMHGKNLIAPFYKAIEGIKTTKQKKIILLTDGIGEDCDQEYIKSIAIAGKGSFSIVQNNRDLKATVIRVLNRLVNSTYSGCQIQFSERPFFHANSMRYQFERDQLKRGFEIYKNELFQHFAIIGKEQFNKLQVQMKSDIHPQTQIGLNHKWTNKNFKSLEKGEDLFRIAARFYINLLQSTEIDKKVTKTYSLFYQIMSKETSFLAVYKNDQQVCGELQLIEIGEKDQIFLSSKSSQSPQISRDEIIYDKGGQILERFQSSPKPQFQNKRKFRPQKFEVENFFLKRQDYSSSESQKSEPFQKAYNDKRGAIKKKAKKKVQNYRSDLNQISKNKSQFNRQNRLKSPILKQSIIRVLQKEEIEFEQQRISQQDQEKVELQSLSRVQNNVRRDIRQNNYKSELVVSHLGDTEEDIKFESDKEEEKKEQILPYYPRGNNHFLYLRGSGSNVNDQRKNNAISNLKKQLNSGEFNQPRLMMINQEEKQSKKISVQMLQFTDQKTNLAIKQKLPIIQSHAQKQKSFMDYYYLFVKSVDHLQKQKLANSQYNLDDLIKSFDIHGYCKNIEIVQSFINELIYMDLDLIREIYNKITKKDILEQVWITILAIYILQKFGQRKKKEWESKVTKAKGMLMYQGIGNLDNIIKKIKCEIVQSKLPTIY